jgi:hypothetical protein
MPALRELQAAMRTALLGGDDTLACNLIHGDGLAPAARLAIYRHHVGTTLSAVLAGIFPVVRRLVDARFFSYAADSYLRAHPPSSPCLFEYGDRFPEFLERFPPCRHLGYLPDVARLEWAFNAAFHADDVAPVAPAALGAVPVTAGAHLRLRLHPSVTYISSRWPLDRIWEAHQEGGSPDGVRLDTGGTHVEVRRTATGDVVCQRLDPAIFSLRQALAAGRSLGDAAAVAVEANLSLDLPAALAALLADTIVVGFGIEEAKEEPS